MATLESMRRRIGSAEDLYGVVRVMKALAAANIRECEKTVESLELYNQTIQHGFHIMMLHASHLVSETAEVDANESQTLATAAIVCGSDQGMCGSFNEQIASFAIRDLKKRGLEPAETPILAIGIRAAGRLEDAKADVQQTLPLPTAVSGVTQTVRTLLYHVEKLRENQNSQRVLIYHHALLSAASHAPQCVQLLPLDQAYLKSLGRKPWGTRSRPTYFMDWSVLFATLIRQHLNALLHKAIAESLASENASRLRSMQAAEKNIEEHLAKLQFQYHQKRQQTITEELLDIVAGFETLTQSHSSQQSPLQKRKNK